MADEPDHIVLIRLAEIRAKQDEHSACFDRLEKEMQQLRKQIDSVSRLATYSLGQSTDALLRQSQQETRVDELFEKLEELLKPKEPA